MHRRDISRAMLGAAVTSALLSPSVSYAQAGCSLPCYPRTPEEFTAGVIPANEAFAPGDVRRYGAVGTGVADDTAAIQKAIDLLPEAPGNAEIPAVGLKDGGIVYLPPGIYKTTAPIRLRRGIFLVGAGKYATQIVNANTGGANAIEVTIAAPGRHAGIQDMRISGNVLSGHGIHVFEGGYMTNARLVITHHGGDGIRIEDTVGGSWYDINSSYNKGNGLFIREVSFSSTAQHFSHGQFRKNGLCGIVNEGHTACFEARIVIESNEDVGLVERGICNAYNDIYLENNESALPLNDQLQLHYRGNRAVFRGVYVNNGAIKLEHFASTEQGRRGQFWNTVLSTATPNIIFVGDASRNLIAYPVVGSPLHIGGVVPPDTTITQLADAGQLSSLGAPDTARAWVNFNGAGPLIIRDSYGVNSVTDNGTGRYTVNFADPRPNANYAIWISSEAVNTSCVTTPTVAGYEIRTSDSSNTAVDAIRIHTGVFGDAH